MEKSRYLGFLGFLGVIGLFGIINKDYWNIPYVLFFLFFINFYKQKEKLKLIGIYEDKKFDKNQLKIGTKIEMEHTEDKGLAEKIAKHHLREHPKYYDFLIEAEKKMERDLKVKGEGKR